MKKIFICMPIGDNIKRIRQLKSVSVADLASRMGINAESIYAWQRGDYNPNEENLQSLAGILGVQVKDFYDENHTSVDKLTDNKGNHMEGDPEVYRTIVEGNTEYVLILRSTMENAEIVSKKQLDASINNMDKIVSKMDNDSAIMRILITKFIETVEKISQAPPNPVQSQKRKNGA